MMVGDSQGDFKFYKIYLLQLAQKLHMHANGTKLEVKMSDGSMEVGVKEKLRFLLPFVGSMWTMT